MFNILVAYDDNRVIGHNNQLPWHLSEDLIYFKKLTIQNIVIMGRNTWESLPKKPLPDRTNFVLSKTLKDPGLKDTKFFNSWFEMFWYTKSLINQSYGKEAFFIGGYEIYTQALKYGCVDEILVTKVHGIHKGDRFFPILSPKEEWTSERTSIGREYDRLIFRRVPAEVSRSNSA